LIFEELLREGGGRQVAEASLFALPVAKKISTYSVIALREFSRVTEVAPFVQTVFRLLSETLNGHAAVPIASGIAMVNGRNSKGNIHVIRFCLDEPKCPFLATSAVRRGSIGVKSLLPRSVHRSDQANTIDDFVLTPLERGTTDSLDVKQNNNV
jgi:hypothetical protein